MIQRGHREALCTLEKIYRDESSIDESEERILTWNQHRFLTEWLGKQQVDGPPIADVKARLKEMIGWLEKQEIKYKVHNSSLSYCNLAHANAYTNALMRSRTINICPYWFEKSPRARAATIIHELVHGLGFGHPDGTVLPIDAYRLAKNEPFKARKSPENYEGLAREYYCSEK